MPSLRSHKASGQCYVVLSGRAVYCGKPDDPAAEQRYHQAVGEWIAAGKQLPAEPSTITVKELLARFWTYAEQYYCTLTDGRNKELEQFTLTPCGKSHSGCEKSLLSGLIVAKTRQIDGFACVPLLDPEQNPALSPTKHFYLTTDG